MSLKKIKVLHVIKSLGRGGAETLIPELLRVHNKDRFDFHCIYFLPWKDQMVDEIKQQGGTVRCFSANNNIRLILKFRELAKYVKEHQIDVVHCHLPWAGFVGRLTYLFYGVKIIYTEHNKQERYHFLTRKINKLTFNWQNLILAVSNDVCSSIKKNINVKSRLEVILNGVNTEKFVSNHSAGEELRQQLGIPKHAVVVGTVAVFRFQKRLKEWLEVFSVAAEKNEDLIAVIVGDGPLKEEILEHRSKLGLDNKVLIPGLKTDVIPYLSLFDIYMMTSVFEGLPIALLEAMSMQCAIVTTNAGGIKEVVKHNTNGLMVDVDHWDKMSDILISLGKDEENIKLLASEARNTVVNNFSLEMMAKQLETRYENLVTT